MEWLDAVDDEIRKLSCELAVTEINPTARERFAKVLYGRLNRLVARALLYADGEHKIERSTYMMMVAQRDGDIEGLIDEVERLRILVARLSRDDDYEGNQLAR